MCSLEGRRANVRKAPKQYHVRQRVIKAMRGEQRSGVLRWGSELTLSRRVQEGFLEEVMFDLGSGMQMSSGRVGRRRERKHSRDA